MSEPWLVYVVVILMGIVVACTQSQVDGLQEHVRKLDEMVRWLQNHK